VADWRRLLLDEREGGGLGRGGGRGGEEVEGGRRRGEEGVFRGDFDDEEEDVGSE